MKFSRCLQLQRERFQTRAASLFFRTHSLRFIRCYSSCKSSVHLTLASPGLLTCQSQLSRCSDSRPRKVQKHTSLHVKRGVLVYIEVVSVSFFGINKFVKRVLFSPVVDGGLQVVTDTHTHGTEGRALDRTRRRSSRQANSVTYTTSGSTFQSKALID